MWADTNTSEAAMDDLLPLMPFYADVFMGGTAGAAPIHVTLDLLVQDPTSWSLDLPHSPPIFSIVVWTVLEPILGQPNLRLLSVDLLHGDA